MTSNKLDRHEVDRYEILELLGQGGMGKVYRAYDPHLNREVVLKFILPETDFGDEWHQRFQREVRAAGSLNHPHIVMVYDVVLEQEEPYVVMEFLRGGTLKERFKADPWPWPEALTRLRPLAEALAYAHRTGVVHRDVKPENVLFTGGDPDTLKLADFGLALSQKAEEGMTPPGEVMGTPAYISPEQVRGEVVDGRSDIFALGLILFEAIVGRNPLNKGSAISSLAEAMSEVQLDLSSLAEAAPPEVVKLIEQAVAKDRDQRYPTCEALLADLAHCLGERPQPSPDQPVYLHSPRPPAAGPEIRVANKIDVPVEVQTVLQAMFNSFSQVAVENEFDRGFTSSRVFRVIPVKAKGKGRLPAVIKVAPLGLIHQEWAAYQAWVENNLPNIARLESDPVLPANSPWGGLHYALVGGGAFEVQSLHDYYRQHGADNLCWILENRLFQIMGPYWWLDNRTYRTFQMQGDYDTLLPVNLMIKPLPAPAAADVHLLEASPNLSVTDVTIGDQVGLKGFLITNVDPKRRQVTLNPPSEPEEWLPVSCRLRLEDVDEMSRYRTGNIIGSIHGQVVATRHDLLVGLAMHSLGPDVDLSARRLTLSNGLSLPNPLLTYQGLLKDFLTVNTSVIHGDLNFENLLVDPATREISLIDFATVRRGHVLHDLLRLETEVVIMLIPPILAEAGLPPETIYSFYEQIHHLTLYSDRVTPPKLPHAALREPFKVLRVIRKMARKCLFNPDDWQEYYRGLVLYLLGVLKFKRLRDLPIAPLPGQVAFWGAATAQHFLERPVSAQAPEPGRRATFSVTLASEPISEIESPYGTMHPESKLYIERDVDHHCWERLGSGRAATLFIQAPRQMGKSSLMRRVLAQAKNGQHKTFAFIDFQRFPEHYFDDEENFLIEFCLMIGDALGLPEAIDQYWQGRRTNIMKCSRYMSEHIIPQVDGPFILAMDEVERMLTSPFQTNFFGMLRTWHNNRAYDQNFANMSLFLSSSTEPYLFIDNPNQSPFNVAEVFILQDFTKSEVEELNQCHNASLNQQQLDELMDWVGGHPFLTRLALYQVATGKSDPETLFTRATDDNGPFGDHLRHYLLRVLQKPDLKQALAHICREHTHAEDQVFHRLKGAGLVMKVGQQVVLRNRLYTRYFEEHLNV